jgi:hypothetical protein
VSLLAIGHQCSSGAIGDNAGPPSPVESGWANDHLGPGRIFQRAQPISETSPEFYAQSNARLNVMTKPVRTSEFVAVRPQAPSPKFQVPLSRAGTSVCRFIIGEANENALCCGAPTDGRSWCDYHRSVVFDPSVRARMR